MLPDPFSDFHNIYNDIYVCIGSACNIIGSYAVLNGIVS